jgi:hypothetical protein
VAAPANAAPQNGTNQQARRGHEGRPNAPLRRELGANSLLPRLPT